MDIAVAGVGQTKFGRSKKGIEELMAEACWEALRSAHAKIDQIDAIYIANFSSSFTGQSHLPSVLASSLSSDKEITRVESACASGGVALKEATIAIESNIYEMVLVVGVEKMSERSTAETTEILATAGSKEEVKHGMTFPSLYALIAQRYFSEYEATERHLAEIAVKNHQNALHNPKAQFHRKITVDEVLRSKIVASPLKLLDSSPISDGAAAVILCRRKKASQCTNRPINLIGIGHSVDAIELYKRKDLTTMPAVVEASRKAFQMAHMDPKEIDVAELHDCFTIAEMIQLEDIGFCKKGNAKQLIEEGRTKIGGSIPINTSGGLKAKGHPIGATGISQVIEIVYQLRGGAGRRQVKNAKIGLCCNIGGVGGSCVVSIFSRSDVCGNS